jgi:hypothetical protein
MQTFFINKLYETSADTLVAIGWAALLQEAFHQRKTIGEILICNRGASFEVSSSRPFELEDLNRDTPVPFLLSFISAKQDEKQAKKGRVLRDGFNYDKEQEKRKQQIGQLQQLAPQLRTPKARFYKHPELQAILKDGPSSQLPHYQTISSMKIVDSFNELVWRWQSLSPAQQWQHIALLCQIFSSPENDIDAAIHSWEKMAKEQGIKGKAMATALQIVNPTTGKGANASKGNRLNAGGLDSFWLLELLKFKGFMIGAAPYSLKGGDDRKTYVILPVTVELQTLSRMMDQFRDICWSSTAIKQDIMAVLCLTQVLLHHRREELTSQQRQKRWERPPIVSIAQGFDITSYKDMGSAYATMNVATINIPNWFPDLSILDDVEEAELLLTEHIRLIRRIERHKEHGRSKDNKEKEGSEEYELLRVYRDFLSGHDLRPFWKFAARYSVYLLHRRVQENDIKRWLPRLTKQGLDILVKKHQNVGANMKEIIENTGFQNIATAIRYATFTAQYRQSQQRDNTYEIRYGLVPDLRRKSRYRTDFMIALNEFLSLYNAENAREEEKLAKKLQRPLTRDDRKRYKLRPFVSKEDLDEFNKLLDKFPTEFELIANMLIGYGQTITRAFKQEEAIEDDNNVQNDEE